MNSIQHVEINKIFRLKITLSSYGSEGSYFDYMKDIIARDPKQSYGFCAGAGGDITLLVLPVSEKTRVLKFGD